MDSEGIPTEPKARAKFLVDRGLALYGRGEVRSAARYWLAALKSDPDSFRARKYLNFLADHEHVIVEEDEALDPAAFQISPEPIGPPRPMHVPHYIPNPPTGPAQTLTSAPEDRSFEVEAQASEDAPEAPRAEASGVARSNDTVEIGQDQGGEAPGDDPNGARARAPAGVPLSPEVEAMLESLREFARKDDLTSVIAVGERILARDPSQPQARGAVERASIKLIRMLEAQLQDVRAVPKVKVPADEVIWLNLNHREGFVLSQVDGVMRYEDILDVCGMPRIEALRVLVNLRNDGVIGHD